MKNNEISHLYSTFSASAYDFLYTSVKWDAKHALVNRKQIKQPIKYSFQHTAFWQRKDSSTV